MDGSTTQKNQGGLRQIITVPPRFAGLINLSHVPRSVLIATITINLLGLALPLVALQVYDRVIPNSATDTLFFLIMAVLATVLIDAMLKIARSYTLGWESSREVAIATIQAVAVLLRTSPVRLAKERTTDWLDSVEAVAEVEAGRGGQVRLVILDLAFLPLFVLFTALIGGALVIVPLVAITVVSVLAWHRGLELEQAIRDRSNHDRRRYDFLAECLGSILTVKAFAMEPMMLRRFERLQKVSATTSMRAITANQSVQVLTSVMANATMVAIVSVGALLIIHGNLTVGAVACCSLLSGRLMQPIIRGAGIWAEIQKIAVAESRAAPIMSLAQTEHAPASTPPRSGPAAIELDDVSFFDSDTRKQLLDAVSLNVAPGEIIGLAGYAGNGWTALFDIICEDLKVDSGHVLIDDCPADQLGDSLRQRIIRVSADSRLFRGSILDNLTLFKRGETIDRARSVARALGLESRIDRLPNGYDTWVDEGSSQVLPAGIIQQVSIARALVCEPGALLFNEANTALDTEGDLALQRTLADLAGQTTVLIVSSRPSMLNIGDRRFALEHGQLVEQAPVTKLHLTDSTVGIAS